LHKNVSTRLPYSTSKLLGVYSAWWLFWATVQTFVLHRLQLSWHVSFVDALVSNTLLAFAGCSAILIYRFYQPGRSNRIYRFVFAITLAGLFIKTLYGLLSSIFSEDSEYLLFLEKSLPVRFIFSLLIISFITLLNWMWSSLSEQKANEKRKAESEQLMKEAELIKLRQQLQPHFLFNSLNSISALVMSKPEEARKMTQQLSDFLRGTLKKEDQHVKLSEELEHLKLYLDIEKVRFGHRLNIEFNANEETLNAQLPSLLLQPIVENAIKFGLYDITGDVTISISADIQTPYLHIEIKNPFDPETKRAQQGVGFGLSSIQRRLYLLYARQDLLLTDKKGNTFITTLKIPQVV
jgi:two-component system, LytTR family, sensor kinase